MRIRCVLAAPWVAIASLLAGAAAADPELVAERAVVVGRVDDGPWTDAPTEARADQKAELAAVVVGRRGPRRVVLAPAGVARVRLGGQALAAEAGGVELAGARVQWSTV